MNASLHWVKARGSIQSLYAFLPKDAAEVANDTQGEIKTVPRRGSDKWTGAMGTDVEGCGCEMWERRDRARFAPAESPVRIMFLGAIERLLSTWFRSAEACWSWRG